MFLMVSHIFFVISKEKQSRAHFLVFISHQNSYGCRCVHILYNYGLSSLHWNRWSHDFSQQSRSVSLAFLRFLVKFCRRTLFKRGIGSCLVVKIYKIHTAVLVYVDNLCTYVLGRKFFVHIYVMPDRLRRVQKAWTGQPSPGYGNHHAYSSGRGPYYMGGAKVETV